MAACSSSIYTDETLHQIPESERSSECNISGENLSVQNFDNYNRNPTVDITPSSQRHPQNERVNSKESQSNERLKHCNEDPGDEWQTQKARGRGRGNRKNRENRQQTFSPQGNRGGRGVICGPRQRQRSARHRMDEEHFENSVAGQHQNLENPRMKHYSASQSVGHWAHDKFDDRLSSFAQGNSPGTDRGEKDAQSTDRDRGYYGRNQTPTSGGKNYYSKEQNRHSSGKRDRDPDVKLSKQLSFMLRHGAEREGLQLMEGGFIYVNDLLEHRNFNTFTLSDIERVVINNDKRRFHIENDEDGQPKIRANQGHTLKVDALEMTEITSTEECPVVVHGTYSSNWESIKNMGLSTMGRNHMHCAPGLPSETDVISDGFKFFRSVNNVILTEGNKKGILPPKYFQKVVDRRTGKELKFLQQLKRS